MQNGQNRKSYFQWGGSDSAEQMSYGRFHLGPSFYYFILVNNESRLPVDARKGALSVGNALKAQKQENIHKRKIEMATVEKEMFNQVQCGAVGRDGKTREANQSIYEKDMKNY